MTDYETHTKGQDIATLYISEQDLNKFNVIEFVRDYLDGNSNAPSGATITEHYGIWKGDTEDGIKIEIWYGGEDELEAVRGLRDGLQETFDQYCVCLKLGTTAAMEHRQPAGE